MTDPIRETLQAPERPVEPDVAFADELFERLREEMGHRARPLVLPRRRRIPNPSLRRVLLAAAVLIVTFAILAAILWPLRDRLVDRSKPAHDVPAVVNGRLVASRAGQIVSMEADGSGEILLTDTGRDYSPAWSPDGRRIAFIRSSGRGSAIWIMDADGSDQIQVSDQGTMVQPPIWSPTGAFIAYSDLSSDAETGAIWRVTPDGQERVRVTTYADGNFLRDWSPDGAKLAFESDRDGDVDIWVMNADGSAPTNLTQNSVSDWGPAFSPDGTRIAFYRGFGRPKHGGWSRTAIWTMNADGSDPVRLTDGSRFDIHPRWSPDGRWIAFRADMMSKGAGVAVVRLYRMAPDGSDLRGLTDRETQALEFEWSPDSTTLVFVDDDYRGIAVVGADGTGFRTVATDPTVIGIPDWQAASERPAG
ncbi:MAG TPA: hypothetical protein VFR44_10430 [Actinomycetota bacterium]|nr:hypothetical protein [Actinomycetota bacterium]